MNSERNIDLIHDGNLAISTGHSRKETRWNKREIKWSKLLRKLSNTIYTRA